MNPITYRITLDLAKSGVQHVLSGFKVGDTNRRLEIRLTNDGVPYEIERGTVAQIRATLPNGSQFASACEVSDNTIAYAVENDLVSVGGEIKADIQLGNAIGEMFSTSEILLLVYPSEIEGDTSLEDNFKTVLQAVAKAEAAADRANTEADTANTATERANTAAEKAEAADSSANSAAQYATEQGNYATEQGNYAKGKADAANTAATNANSAKEAAISAANNANSAANTAQGQAEAANEAAALAKSEASKANNAASNANSEASKANTATERANTATENANTATTAANQATDNANEAAALANEATNKANAAAAEAEAKAISSAVVNSSGNLIVTLKDNTALNAGYVIGAKGDKGNKGDKGDKGEKGDKGDSASDLSLLANALKGSSSGNPIRLDDVSPLEHEMTVKVDIGGAIVKKYGKNLFDSSLLKQAYNWKYENGYYYGEPSDLYTKYSKSSGNSLFDDFLPNTQYTLSFKGYAEESNPNGTLGLVFYYSDGTTTSLKIKEATEKSVSLTSTTGKTVVALHATYNFNYISYLKDIQLEVGTTATEYEPYKEPVTYTADENGIVSDVTSLYPTTTLIAEDGVIITAEYNKEINKVVNDIYQKLSALSAAVVNNG